ncbi:AAA family ATPase [Flavobacterium sp. Fl-77]|uniref:AAA family ATPase n=1 Tax=Flavobacterium flavipigmentatum TaxID=2893884 RepID=A0AAJ2SJD3_9FLAO|nr:MULTISPECIES: AAA family ATPase [unclassified Flavobacterium]MDX6183993.1 AAA family ATPase [Flavobacterium sp. Fl-33]MDX6187546.1 AAA family ATPase [Flavobacterium sp. Fl-77]UFH38439.1 AAA family ATPase [Flavobacterium sp. F-70]
MRKVILMRGLPGSGKSTMAKNIVAENPEIYKRINRDDLRTMFDNGITSSSNEKFVKKVRDILIVKSLEEGKSIVVDDTNLSETNLRRISQLVQEYNAKYDEKVTVEVMEVNTDVAVCIERDGLRKKPVGEKVIRKMHRQFFKDSPEYAPQNPTLPKAIICDLDGTLALMNGRNPFDASTCDQDLINTPVANVLKNYKKLGYKILLVSGREDRYKEPTLRFLAQHEIEFDELIMRKTKDSRKDSIIKTEIYNDAIKEHYFVEFVLDDRNQVVDTWRNDLKLPCFQVYYGDF